VQQLAATAKEAARNSDGIKRIAEELGFMAKNSNSPSWIKPLLYY
jgi:hypothetical protein